MKKDELLRSMFADSPVPTVLLDNDLNSVWQNEEAQKRYPTLALPQGIRLMLSPEQNERLEDELKGEKCIILPIGATGMQLVLQPCGGEWIAQLITSMGWESSALDPQGTQRAVASVNSSLRAPLAKIFSGVSSAARQADRDESEELFCVAKEINEAGYELLRFANNISTYMRCVYGSLQPRNRIFEIGEMLRELLSASALMTCKAGVPLEMDIPDEKAAVNADPELLAHALLQIINNSCRYTREDNRITVSLSVKDDSVRITVADRGLGITSDRLAHASRPFYSWDPEGRPDTGNGLGLTIAQYLITSAGGTLALSSTEGEGTTVAIRLPRASADEGSLASVKAQVDYLRDRFSPVQVILSSCCGAPHP